MKYVVGILVCLCALPASALWSSNTSVTIAWQNADHVESFSWAEYTDDSGNRVYGKTWGSHCVDDADSAYSAYCVAFETYESAYSGYISIYGQNGCHTAQLYAHFNPLFGITGSDTEKSASTCTGGSGGSSGGSGDSYNVYECNQFTITCASPIILSLDASRCALTSVTDGVRFDLTADGLLETTSWTDATSKTAFLGLDTNRNGMIDSGAELFGNFTPLGAGRAPNGFVALASYDANGDGGIDAADPIWPSLLLWLDRNHNGVSEPAELLPISRSSVVRLGLNYEVVGIRDRYGNRYRYKGRMERMDERGSVKTDAYYDVLLVVAR